MNKPPTIEDFKKIKEKLKTDVSWPIWVIIPAEDLNDLLEGKFKVYPGVHIEKDRHNIFVV